MPSVSSGGLTATVQSSTVADWSAKLAEPIPNPGGGAGAGVVLASAAALIAMVAGYSIGNGEPGEPEAIAARAQSLRRRALEFADLDGQASERLAHAYRLGLDAPERDVVIRAESLAAAGLCATMADLAIAGIGDIERLAEIGKPALIADVVVAAAFLRSALAALRTNIGVDLGGLLQFGDPAESVRSAQPALWQALTTIADAIIRLDGLQPRFDELVIPGGDG